MPESNSEHPDTTPGAHDADAAAREATPSAGDAAAASASPSDVETRAGIVTVAGRPNAGKSTLLNRLVGEKLSIISAKPQSTRDRVVGIVSDATTQMIVLDTPGLMDPAYELQQAMRGAAISAVRDADVIIYVADGTAGAPPPFAKAIGPRTEITVPIITVLNKMDLVNARERDRMMGAIPDAVAISARTGEGMLDLFARVRALLPVSPFLYPADEISTQPVRFFAAELVRETALEQLSDEVPYSVACEIEEFRESQSPVYIRATLFVERDSQKSILIGKDGARIREIGRASRAKIERFVDGPVYLDLRVKVLANWRRRPQAMRRFGYVVPKEER